MMSHHVLKAMAKMLHLASSRALPWTCINGCKKLLRSRHHQISIFAADMHLACEALAGHIRLQPLVPS